MADTKKYVSVKPTRLSSRASVGATTLNVESIQDVLGSTLTMTDFGDKGFGVINPGSTDVRLIVFTGISSTQITGVSETLAKAPYTESAGLTNEFGAGTTIILYTNAPSFYNTFANKDNDETITGTWGFSASPTVPTGGTGTQAANADDIANAISGASGTATEAVFGTVKLSTAAAAPANPIAVGDNDARVPTTGENNALVGNNTDIAVGTGNKFVTQTGLQKQAENYATSTTGNDTYVVTLSPVPTSYAAGMVVRMKPDTANTGAATINVNSLGAKDILKNGAAVLADGDIPANSVVTLVYDGTQFILQGVLPLSIAQGTTLTAGAASNADTLHIHSPQTLQAIYDSSSGYVQVDLPFVSSSTGSATGGWATGTGDATYYAGGVRLAPANSNTVSICTGTYTGAGPSASAGAPLVGLTLSDRFYITFNALMTGDAQDDCWLGVSDSSNTVPSSSTRHAAFFIDNGVIKCITANAGGGANETTTTPTNITYSKATVLTIFNNAGTNVLFYINNTLVATHTTNLPTTSGVLPILRYTAGGSGTHNMFVLNPVRLYVNTTDWT
jgi:hypothetical protein